MLHPGEIIATTTFKEHRKLSGSTVLTNTYKIPPAEKKEGQMMHFIYLGFGKPEDFDDTQVERILLELGLKKANG